MKISLIIGLFFRSLPEQHISVGKNPWLMPQFATIFVYSFIYRGFLTAWAISNPKITPSWFLTQLLN